MPKKQDTHSNQLSLDLDSAVQNPPSHTRTTANVVYLSDTVQSRIESHENEILTMFSDYAAKLNW